MDGLGDNIFAPGRSTLRADTPHNPVPKNRTYPKGRTCVVCSRSISIYNKHKTCWEHTEEELYVSRGTRRAKAS